ncbi:MAG: hypothetical protein ABI822_01970 [Bryobacteraceae bacterium]
MSRSVPTRQQVALALRSRWRSLVWDNADGARGNGYAIYTLSDPRDVRAVRYVGQSSDPPRRYCQHVQAARVWLADRPGADGGPVPWWLDRSPARDLSIWIRELYADGARLPVMMVQSWLGTLAQALRAERDALDHFVADGRALLNQAAVQAGPQLRLDLSAGGWSPGDRNDSPQSICHVIRHQ